MAQQQDVKQALKKANTNNKNQVSKSNQMEALLRSYATAIAERLPEQVSSERFQRIALSAFSTNPKLAKCNPYSYIAAVMESAQLGLEPNTALGQAYLIPYGDKVQFQVGYKGLLELAHRSKMYKAIYTHTVYSNDDFEIEYGLNPRLDHMPYLEGDRGEPIGYYAVYKLINGGEGFSYMTKREVLNHAQRFSKTFKDGPWQTDFDSMAKKTVLKQALKYGPMSIEVQQAQAIDEKTVEVDRFDKNKKALDEIEWQIIDEQTGEILEGEEE